MRHVIINTILVHIVLAFIGRFITLYLPSLSENPVVELLNMNQRKIVTTSVMIGISVSLGSYLVERNIKIKGL